MQSLLASGLAFTPSCSGICYIDKSDLKLVACSHPSENKILSREVIRSCVDLKWYLSLLGGTALRWKHGLGDQVGG